MAEKYDIENVMAELLFRWSAVCEFITIQGETYGESVQKRDYGLKEHKFMAFNVILGYEDGSTKSHTKTYQLLIKKIDLNK
jgi:hypothetical protein